MNETALVIGGTGKIGKVFSLFLIKNKYKIIIASRSKKKFNEFINFLKTNNLEHQNVFWKKLDITSDISVKKFVLSFKYKKFSHVILSALLGSRDINKLFSFKDYKNDYQNLLANPIYLIESFVRNMRIQKKGKIIITSSMLGVKVPDFNIYTNTKYTPSINTLVSYSGLIYYVKTLAVREKNNNISCCALLPGFFTKSKKRDKFIKNLEKIVPLSRIGNQEDLETAVNFLLSDSNYFNGQGLLIDGGLSLL